MSRLDFRYSGQALHFPELRLWLDAHRARGPGEAVVVSHAHSDHTAAHAEIFVTPPTQKLMRARVKGTRIEHVLTFGTPADLRTGKFGTPRDVQLTLLPAGHIFGSAMVRLEAAGESVLYTGDYKLRAGLTAEECQPVPARVLIMETTFGRPEYVFPPAAEVMTGVIRFCREALDHDEIPVLLGYSLGKAQEILAGFRGTGLSLMLDQSVAKLTKIYQELGQTFPPYVPWDPDAAAGRVVLAPPGLSAGRLRQQLPRARIAVLTGWAVDPGCCFQYRAEAAFPLSDHADFPELLEFVRRVAPERIYTLHGFAADFAATLRGLGYDAHGLGKVEQLEFPLGAVGRPLSGKIRPVPVRRLDFVGASPAPAPPGTLAAFAVGCAEIAMRTEKNAKITRLVEMLRTMPEALRMVVTRWVEGRRGTGPSSVHWPGAAAVRRAAVKVIGGQMADLRFAELKSNDLAEAVAEWFEGHAADSEPVMLTEVAAVVTDFERDPSAAGLMAILARCGPGEARILVKLLAGDLRLGLNAARIQEAVELAGPLRNRSAMDGAV